MKTQRVFAKLGKGGFVILTLLSTVLMVAPSSSYGRSTWKGTLRLVNESGSIGEMHLKIRGKRISGRLEVLKDRPSFTKSFSGRLKGRKLRSDKKRQKLKATCFATGDYPERIEMSGKLRQRGRKFSYKGSKLIRIPPPLTGISEPNHFIARLHFQKDGGWVQWEPNFGESISSFRNRVENEFNNNSNPNDPYSFIEYIPTDSTGYWSTQTIYTAKSKGKFRN